MNLTQDMGRHRPPTAASVVAGYRRSTVKTAHDDRALLESWNDGDAAAGRELLRRYGPRLVRFFRHKAHDHVEDLVQTTLERALRNRARVRDAGAFRSFLFGIAYNVLREHVRREAKRPIVDIEDLSLHDLATSPTGRVAKHSRRDLVVAALSRIPLAMQVTLELYYWEELPAPRIAEALGLPEGTIRTRIRRGRAALLDKLTQLDQGEHGLPNRRTLDGWTRRSRPPLPDA